MPTSLLLNRLFFYGIAAGLSVAAHADAQQPDWPATSLNGRIITVRHEAVPAAEVWVTNALGERVGRTFADGGGFYQLGRLPSGPLRVHARAAGKVEGSMAVAAQGIVREATLPLEEGEDLELVLRFPDGEPVADADVLVSRRYALEEPFAWWRDAKTDERGVASLAGVPMRDLKVQIHRPGLAIHHAVLKPDGAGRAALVVPKQQVEPHAVRVAGVPEGLSAELRCCRANARAGAVPGLPRSVRAVRVGADGTAQLWPLTIAHEVRVVAEGQRSMPIYVTLKPGDGRDIDFTLSPLPADLVEPSTIITGRVVDTLGRPMPRLAVAARCKGRRATPVWTDDQGRFEIDVPAREKVLFEACVLSREHFVATPGFSVGASGLAWLRRPADPNTPLRLDVAFAGSVQGLLRRPDGQPWAAARVELTAAESNIAIVSATDAGGRLRVPGVPPGTYALTVIGGDGMRATGSVTVAERRPSEPEPLTFVPTGEVTGTVTGPDGEPVVGVAIGIAPVFDPRAGPQVAARLRSYGSLRQVLTDRQGRFRWPCVAEGRWSVNVTTKGRVKRFVLGNAGRQVDVEGGERAEIEVTLDG